MRDKVVGVHQGLDFPIDFFLQLYREACLLLDVINHVVVVLQTSLHQTRVRFNDIQLIRIHFMMRCNVMFTHLFPQIVQAKIFPVDVHNSGTICLRFQVRSLQQSVHQRVPEQRIVSIGEIGSDMM